MAIAFACMNNKINVAGLCTTFWKPEERRLLVLAMLKELGFDGVPCFSGASSAIGGDVWAAGEDEKYWGNQFPFYEERECAFGESKNAVQWIIDEAQAPDQRLTLLGIGPATNFALALQKKPEIKNGINEIILMGGNSIDPDIKEYNLCRDIKAYEILINSDLPITLAPIEATKDLCLDDFQSRLLSCGKVGLVLNELYELWKPFKRDKKDAILYDVAAAMFLSNPEVFEVLEGNFALDKEKGLLRESANGRPVRFIKKINHRAFWNCFFETIGSN
jgi:inosine-uridine nucleoside N-ribohydrolase